MAEKLNREAIMSELETLQLEETRERVEEMRQKRASKRQRAANRQRDIASANEMQRRRVAGCWHKKGGKGVEMLAHGNDANYAVVKHTLSHGPKIVLCQRCYNVWEPPPLELRKSNPAEYKRLWDEYQWALNLPTDNEESGTQLFVITENVA
jgi:hypothetical protein